MAYILTWIYYGIGVVIFIGGGILPGYSGPIMNPARCFGPAVAMDNYEGQLIYWFGPLSASILLAVLYWAVPPQHVAIRQEAKEHRKAHANENNNKPTVNIDMEILQTNNEIGV